MTQTEKMTYSVSELAEHLSCSLPTAYALTKQEGFPAVRISPRRVVIPKAELSAWLAARSGRAV